MANRQPIFNVKKHNPDPQTDPFTGNANFSAPTQTKIHSYILFLSFSSPNLKPIVLTLTLKIALYLVCQATCDHSVPAQIITIFRSNPGCHLNPMTQNNLAARGG